MAPNRRFVSWTLAVMSALAFVVGASAQQLARVVSQAVVTPDDLRAAGSTAASATAAAGAGTDGPRRTQRQPRRPGRTAPGHHERGQDRRRHLQGPPHRRDLVLRDSEGAAEQGFPLEHADQEDDDRRRLRRTERGQPRHPLGDEGRPRSAPEHRLHRRRRHRDADREAVDDATTRRSSARSTSRPTPVGRSGHRRHVAVHDRRAEFSARGRIGGRGYDATARSSRRRCRSRRTSTSRSHRPSPGAPIRPPLVAGKAARARRAACAAERHGADASQHGEAAREADDAARCSTSASATSRRA